MNLLAWIVGVVLGGGIFAYAVAILMEIFWTEGRR